MARQFRVVLTGGPGSGKTTTLRGLKKLCGEKGLEVGFVEEAARDIKQESLAKGSLCLPETRPFWFQLRTFRVQQKRERRPREPLVFMDRSKIDGLAYLRLAGYTAPRWLLKNVHRRQYDWVAFLEFPASYRQDAERPESEETAREIAAAIWDTYEGLGYKLEKIPASPPRKRAEYVLEEALEKSDL